MPLKNEGFILLADTWNPATAAVSQTFAGDPGYNIQIAVLEPPVIVSYPPGLRLGNYGVSLLGSEGGQWSAAPNVTVGSVGLNNADRRYDAALALDWKDRGVWVWSVPTLERSPDLPTLTAKFSAVANSVRASVTEGGSEITVGLRPAAPLDVEINAEVYSGFAACTRLSGGRWGTTAEMLRIESSSFTVRCRIRHLDTAAHGALVTHKEFQSASSAGWSLEYNGGFLGFYVSDGTTQRSTGSSAGPGITNRSMEWTDIHAVYDADVPELRLYVGGTLLDSDAATGLGSLLNTQEFRVGIYGNPVWPLDGDIDEVALWRRALTDAEVAASAGKPTPTDSPALLARYAFDEATGAVAATSAAMPIETAIEGPAYVDIGAVHDKGASDSFVLEIMAAVFSSGSTQVLAGKGASAVPGAGGGGYRLAWVPGSGIQAIIWDTSTGSGQALWGTSNDLSATHRYTMEVDRTAQTLRLLVDGVEVASDADISDVGTLSNSSNFHIGARGDAGIPIAARTMLSDCRIWSAVRTDEEYADDAERRVSGTETNLAGYWRLDEGTGTTCADSAASNDGTITGTPSWHSLTLAGTAPYAWVGSGEGGAELAGKRKLRVYGHELRARGYQVDPVDLVWQVSALPCESIKPWIDGYDGGWAPHSTPDVADIWGTTPAAGTYVTNLDEGQIKFASHPGGEIAFEVKGDNRGGYRARAATIAEKIITTDAGLLGAKVDSAQVSLVRGQRFGIVGYQTGDERETAGHVVAELFRMTSSWYVFQRDGTWYPSIVSDPGTPSATVAAKSVADGIAADYEALAISRSDAGRIICQVVARYARYRVTPREQDVPGAVSDADRADAVQPWRAVATPVDETAAERGGEVLVIDTAYRDAEDALAEGLRVLARRSTARATYTVRIDRAPMDINIGTTVRLLAPLWDLDAGRRFRVGGFSEDESASHYQLILEGPRDEP